MQRVVWEDLSEDARAAVFSAAPGSDTARAASIEIVEGIRREGDRAVFEYARRLDGFTGESFRVSPAEIDAARAAAIPADIAAMEAAIGAVRAFHKEQGLGGYEIETWPGVTCRRRVDAIRSVGLYVPAGSAPLVSTLIMLAVPAQIAGVPEITVTVPPGPNGRVNASVLAVASLLGLTNVYVIGGAQAIAALAFGAAGVPRAAKIFGPGNAWVMAAKSHVSTLPGGPAIDLPAGPSEVMVIADETARPDFVAADVLAQAEHDPLARVFVVSVGANIDAIEAEITRQLGALPRETIAAQSLARGAFIIATDREAAVAIAEFASPEHLIIQTDLPDMLARDITTAGSIFVGAWTPESMGDYAAGPNHTLPTGGAGRAFSGVTVEAFQRTTTIIESSRCGASEIGSVVERLAALEGLDGHATAMKMRRVGG